MTPSASRFNAHGMRHPNASTQHNAPIVDPVKPPEHKAADEQMVEVHSHGSSGVGVLDKATLILDCLEAGPVSLGDLVKATDRAPPRRGTGTPPPRSPRRAGTLHARTPPDRTGVRHYF